MAAVGTSRVVRVVNHLPGQPSVAVNIFRDGVWNTVAELHKDPVDISLTEDDYLLKATANGFDHSEQTELLWDDATAKWLDPSELHVDFYSTTDDVGQYEDDPHEEKWGRVIRMEPPVTGVPGVIRAIGKFVDWLG